MKPEHLLILVDLLFLYTLKLACFFIGYLVIRIGADLLRDGIKGEFKFKSSISGVKADLVSASPGLLFLLLGTLLIGYAMWVPKVIPFTTVESNSSEPPPKVPLPSVKN